MSQSYLLPGVRRDPPCKSPAIITGSLCAAGRWRWENCSPSPLYSIPIHSAFLVGGRGLTVAGMAAVVVEVEKEVQSNPRAETGVDYTGGGRCFYRQNTGIRFVAHWIHPCRVCAPGCCATYTALGSASLRSSALAHCPISEERKSTENLRTVCSRTKVGRQVGRGGFRHNPGTAEPDSLPNPETIGIPSGRQCNTGSDRHCSNIPTCSHSRSARKHGNTPPSYIRTVSS